MDEADKKEKMALVSYLGLYQFTVKSFGLAGAPAIFQQLMSIVLSGL